MHHYLSQGKTTECFFFEYTFKGTDYMAPFFKIGQFREAPPANA